MFRFFLWFSLWGWSLGNVYATDSEMILGRIAEAGHSGLTFSNIVLAGIFFTFLGLCLKSSEAMNNVLVKRFCMMVASAGLFSLTTFIPAGALALPSLTHLSFFPMMMGAVMLAIALDYLRLLCLAESFDKTTQSLIFVFHILCGMMICSIFLSSMVRPDSAGSLLLGTWLFTAFGGVAFAFYHFQKGVKQAEIALIAWMPAIAGMILGVGVGGETFVSSMVRFLGWCASLGAFGYLTHITLKLAFESHHVSEKIELPVETKIGFTYNREQKTIHITDKMAEILHLKGDKRIFSLEAIKALLYKNYHLVFEKILSGDAPQGEVAFHSITQNYHISAEENSLTSFILTPIHIIHHPSEDMSVMDVSSVHSLDIFFQKIRQTLKNFHEQEGSFFVILLSIKDYNEWILQIGRKASERAVSVLLERITKSISGFDNNVTMLTAEDEIAVFFYAAENEKDMVRLKNTISKQYEIPLDYAEGIFFADCVMGTASQHIDFFKADKSFQGVEGLYNDAKRSLLMHKNFTLHSPHIFKDIKFPAGTNILTLSADLRYAPEQNRIEPYFKPIFSLKHKRIVGFEVTSAWVHPDFGVLTEDILTPLSIRNGYEEIIYRIILVKATERVTHWNKKLPETNKVFVTVPLSRNVLLASQAPDEDIILLRQKTGFQKESLHISFTQECLHEESSWLAEILTDLKRNGVTLELDNFGAEKTNLLGLSELPFDRVTLNGRLAHDILHDERKYYTLKSLMGMLSDLNIRVDMKDVACEKTMPLLRELGVDHISGTVCGSVVSSGGVFALLSHKNEMV